MGQTFSSQLVFGGGTAPYTFSIVAGALPPGLTLDQNTGLISGTPTAAGVFSFTAQVKDGSGQTATSTCTAGCTPPSCNTTWDFSTPTGCLPSSTADYTANGVTITASAYNTCGYGQTPRLYGKQGGGDENGLGICGAKDNEITKDYFIQLDLTQLLASGAPTAQMWIGSVQAGEGYKIYGSNTNGQLGTLLATGTSDNTPFTIPQFGTWKFVSVTADASHNCYANVLLGGVSVTCAGVCSITIAPPPPPPPPPHNCTYTIGYYKNHPSAITPLPVYLGTFGGPDTLAVTTQQIGVDVESQNVYGVPSNGITKLYAQLLAAKLNILNGASVPSVIATAISQADAFLATHSYTDWSSLTSADKCNVLLWQCALDSYNNGNIGPGHCGDSTCSKGGSSGGDDGSDNGGKGDDSSDDGHGGDNGGSGSGDDHGGQGGNCSNSGDKGGGH